MESEPLPRKLAAILYADVVGYSRLTGEDEDATHRRLSAYLDHITLTIERHGGRVMHYAGDAVLAMFEAVVDALSCAAHIQNALKARNEELPDERKVQFRIGVNLGDVIEDRGDIYGDGVNVAARLESLAEPGGICISESVHTAVGSKLPFDYAFLGEQAVKNIAKPVKAYHARVKPGAVLAEPSVRPKLRRPMRHAIAATAAAVVLVIGAGVIAWWQPWQTREAPASVENMAFPLPEKPSIAVLPFKDTSGNPEKSYIANATSDAIRWALARCPTLFVVDDETSRTLEDKPVAVKQVAEELGVRYVLKGSVQAAEDRIRIGAQLVDALSGRHIWAEIYDGNPNKLFDFQDKVSQQIVDELEVKLTEGEMIRIWRRQTENRDAYRRFREGFEAYKRRTREDNAKARELFTAALDLDPNFAEAQCQLGWTYVLGVFRGWEKDYKEAYARAEELATTAIRKDPGYPHAYALLGSIYVWRDHAPDKALELFEKAVELEPNHGINVANWAWALAMSGRPGEALDAIESAMRISPYYPDWYLGNLGVIYLQLERYNEAAAAFEARFERNPRSTLNHIYLVAAYSMADQPAEAKRVADGLLKRKPNFALKYMEEWMPFKDPADRERILSAAEKGGLPRQPPLG